MTLSNILDIVGSTLTEKSHAFHMQIMRGTHVTYIYVFKQKLHTISTCITQTCTRKSHVVTRRYKLQMSHHMQSTYKAHRKPFYHTW